VSLERVYNFGLGKKLQLCEKFERFTISSCIIVDLVINYCYELILFSFLYCVEILFIFAYCTKILCDCFPDNLTDTNKYNQQHHKSNNQLISFQTKDV
jgi:hypothetical protein